MMPSTFRRSLLSLTLTAALLAGCVSNPPAGDGQAAAAAAAGPAWQPYVTHAERLKPAASPDALSWKSAETDFRHYKSVALERIRVALAGDAKENAIDPADLAQLTGYFHDAIAKNLGKEYPLANQTGPGVLRVRIVIFDLVPTSVATSVAVLFTPYATLPDLAAGAATEGGAGASPYLGRTGIAVQFFDGASGQLVGEYVETRFGKKYVVDTSGGATGAVSAGISNYTKSFSAWDYAKQAFDAWGAQFRQWLDVQHGRAKS